MTTSLNEIPGVASPGISFCEYMDSNFSLPIGIISYVKLDCNMLIFLLDSAVRSLRVELRIL